MLTFPNLKDPDDVEDFALDWDARLATGETLSTLAVTAVGASCTVADSDISGTLTVARISGGTAGSYAIWQYRVTTSTGRQLDQSARVNVGER